jgi:hypothetical protein
MKKRERIPALRVVQADQFLRAEHEQLTAEGYTLAEFLRVAIDRRRGKARMEAEWNQPAPEIGPKARRTMSHIWTLDLRKHAR